MSYSVQNGQFIERWRYFIIAKLGLQCQDNIQCPKLSSQIHILLACHGTSKTSNKIFLILNLALIQWKISCSDSSKPEVDSFFLLRSTEYEFQTVQTARLHIVCVTATQLCFSNTKVPHTIHKRVSVAVFRGAQSSRAAVCWPCFKNQTPLYLHLQHFENQLNTENYSMAPPVTSASSTECGLQSATTTKLDGE